MRSRVPHVALIIETSMAYGRGLLRGIARYVTEHGPWSIYVDQRSLNDPPPAWLQDWNGHGVIMRAQTRRLARVVADLQTPAVDTLHQFAELSAPLVIPDHRAVAAAAAEHLLERHFRHFAFVGVERAYWSKARRDALIEILRHAGFPCHVYSPLSRRRFADSWEGSQQDLAEWLSDLPKPLGVVAAHDLRALCVLDACRRGGLAVPEQVAVVGVDNDEPLCSLGDPPLTSIVLDHELIGYQAAGLLDRMMQGKKPPKKPVTVKPRGVAPRRSTDFVAVDDQLTASAVRFIHEYACHGMDVPDVARHCGVSRRTLERTFSQFLGMSPHDQIVRTKVARAKQLLAESDYPLDVVAAKSGLAHAAYLNVLFKREVGQTPGEYRRSSVGGMHP
ncbi:MAG: DNA-binding transcriptional regulator [Pirellulales bacterium]|nr:DNA-binding transcriptional regulator [Pirellulales bacterium]